MSDVSPTMLWAITGLLLLIIEMFTLSFVVVFFGVAALLVAGLKYLGILGPDQFALELLVFGVLGLSCLFAFRKKVLRNFKGADGHAIDHQQVVTATVDIPARGSAKIEYQGTLWDAENEGDRAITRGSKLRVIRTAGIKLIVRAES